MPCCLMRANKTSQPTAESVQRIFHKKWFDGDRHINRTMPSMSHQDIEMLVSLDALSMPSRDFFAPSL